MKRIILYLMAVFLVSGIGAYAADGDFDTTFDGDGKVNPATEAEIPSMTSSFRLTAKS
jgi:hypothetical protein